MMLINAALRVLEAGFEVFSSVLIECREYCEDSLKGKGGGDSCVSHWELCGVAGKPFPRPETEGQAGMESSSHVSGW